MRKLPVFLMLSVLAFAAITTALYLFLSKDILAPGKGLGDTYPKRASTSPNVEAPSLDFVGASVPREAAQLILPDGHPEFPLDLVWVVVTGDERPIEVPIPLTIPASWQGKYTVRVEGNTAIFDYTASAAIPAKIFSVTALTEGGWQALQNEPHGEWLYAYGGIVWIYNPALENPYDGQQADEFSQMVGEAYGAAHSLGGYFTPQINRETTFPVLQSYFDTLRAGNYAEAARMFGGDLEVLAAHNPDVDPQDGAALFERACTINGFVCSLKINEIVAAEQKSETAVKFTLTLHNPDGSTFELGPCCEAYPTDSPTQTEFTYTVAWQDGRFLVMDLPVYVP